MPVLAHVRFPVVPRLILGKQVLRESRGIGCFSGANTARAFTSLIVSLFAAIAIPRSVLLIVERYHTLVGVYATTGIID
jgi:hypothetical protein